MLVELREMGLAVETEKSMPVQNKGELLGDYYADLLVEERVAVVWRLLHIHYVRLINYLKGTGVDVGLLINFGQPVTVKRKYRVYSKTNLAGL